MSEREGLHSNESGGSQFKAQNLPVGFARIQPVNRCFKWRLAMNDIQVSHIPYQSNRSWFFVMCVWCAIGSMPLTAASLEGGEGKKLVQVGMQHREDAVMITRVKIGDFVVPCGLLVAQNIMQPYEEFEADSNWLKNMTIGLFNRTNKTIVAFTVTLAFPETSDGVTPVHVSIFQAGRIPESVAYSGRTGLPLPQNPAQSAIAFLPEQEYVIHVGAFLDDIKRNVEHVMPLASVSQCRIHIGPFWFEDGMGWDVGKYFVGDPATPGKRVTLADDFFPGNRYRNWPPAVAAESR